MTMRISIEVKSEDVKQRLRVKTVKAKTENKG
jgi:hypothetical protein